MVIFLFIAVVESPLENANKKGKKNSNNTQTRTQGRASLKTLNVVNGCSMF